MGWNALTSQDVLPDGWAEKAIMDEINTASALPDIVANVIAEVRGFVQAGNYPLGPDGTVPDALRNDAIAIARWRFVLTIPKNEQLQTREREDDFKRALDKLSKVAEQRFNLEEVDAGSNPATGTWNSENKILMRTHPVPAPSTSQSTDPTQRHYANPERLTDQ